MMYTVYRITNNINNKIYVGYHATDTLDDGYMGSGKLIRHAMTKYGPEAFTKEIIAVFDNKTDAEKLEREIVNEEFTLRGDTYNLAQGGDEAKAKISKASTGRISTQSHAIIVNGVVYRGYIRAGEAAGFDTNHRVNVIRCAADPDIDLSFEDERLNRAAIKYVERKTEGLINKVKI